MITSYEVGTIFKIIDRSESTRRNMIADMTRLEQLSAKTKQSFILIGNQRLGGLSRSIIGLTEQTTKMQAELNKTFAGITAGTASAVKETRTLAAELGNVARAARSANAAGIAARNRTASGGGSLVQAAGSGERGGRGNFGNFHLSQRGRLPGGSHFGLSGGGMAGNAVLAAAGLIGYGVYQESELRNTVARMMLAAGQPLSGNMMQAPLAQAIRNAIQKGSVETGLSPRELESSATKLTLQMGGIPFGQRVGMLPEIFRFAGIESRLKGVDAGDATQSLVGLLHMTGAYKPADISKLASQFAFASTISPVGLPGIERAASYVLPMGVNALGLDPGSLLLMMAQAQSAGILQGKAGTWFQGMLQSLSPKGGFASLLTGHGAKGRMGGLRQLGLVHDAGAPAGLRMLEKNDWSGFIGTVKQHLDAIPQEQRMGVVSQAMGSAQAARGLMTFMLPAMIQLLPELRREQQNFAHDPSKTLNDLWKADPVVKFQAAMRQVDNVLMDIGNIALPLVLVGLQSFDELLKNDIAPIVRWISDHVPGGTSGGGLLNRVTKGAIKGSIIGAGTGFWFDGVGAIPGALIGGGIGALSGIMPHGSSASASPTVLGTPNAVNTIPVPGSSITGSLLSPSSPAAGMFHKMSYTGPVIGGSGTWSDIGQGSPYSVPFPTTTGNGPTVGGLPVIKAAYYPGGGLPIVGGAGALPMGNLPISGLGSNAYVAARRAGFAKELKDPNKRLQFAAMLLSEGSPLATAESAMNRSDMTHKSLMQMLHSGFYGPINRGQLPAFMARLKRNPKLMARMNAVIGTVLGGSDTISGFTDQGMPSDPNGPWIMRHAHKLIGGNVFGDWGGGGGHAASERWRQQFESGALANTVPPHWTTGDIATALHGGSPLIPHGHDKPIVIQHTSTLDGRVVAENTMRHIVRQGNGPARGPRTADYTAVRPINV